MNINLNPWELQEPNGSLISGSQLSAGFSDSFFRPQQAVIQFTCPTSGVTTTHSLHPRSELREVATWGLSGTNTLSATLTVNAAAGSVVVGQMFNAADIPYLEMFYEPGTGIVIQSEDQKGAGLAGRQALGGAIPVGTQFSYQIQAVGSQVTVTVNGTSVTPNAQPIAGQYYFKAGDYIQYGSGSSAVVTFSALSVSHH